MDKNEGLIAFLLFAFGVISLLYASVLNGAHPVIGFLQLLLELLATFLLLISFLMAVYGVLDKLFHEEV